MNRNHKFTATQSVLRAGAFAVTVVAFIFSSGFAGGIFIAKAQSSATAQCSATMHVDAGDTVTWTADVSASGSVTNYEWGGSEGLKGSGETVTHTYTSSGFKTAELSANVSSSGGGGASASCSISGDTIEEGSSEPAVDLAVNDEDGPVSVDVGENFTVAWTTQNDPETCTASGAWSGDKDPAGGSEVFAATTDDDRTFEITCENEAGSISDSVLVTVQGDNGGGQAPTVDLTANGSDGPVTVEQEEDVTLAWTTENNPDTCTASGAWSGDKILEGSEVVSTSTTGTFTYILTCENDEGSGEDSIDIIVESGSSEGEKPGVNLRINGNDNTATVGENDPFTLSWTTTNDPQTCLASGEWSGSKDVSGGSQEFSGRASGSYAFSLACGNENGTTTDEVTLTVENDDNNNGGGSTATCSASETITVEEGQTIRWTSDVSFEGEITEVTWSGDDNLTGASTTITHTYETAGEKVGTVEVTAESDSSNASCTIDAINAEVVDRDDDDDDDDGGGGNGTVGGSRTQFLRIANERVSELVNNVAFVQWDTNLSATSRVVYDTEPIDEDAVDEEQRFAELGANSTVTLTKRVESHGMAVTGLQPDTTYYFRPISTRGERTAIGDQVQLTIGQPQDQCFYLRDYLRRDFDNDPQEVEKLQRFLRDVEGYNIPITGTFGQETFNAVVAFQERYYEDVLQPWGYMPDEGTGYVYITTRKKINEIVCDRAFPLDGTDREEIRTFRSYLEQLRAEGADFRTQPEPEDEPVGEDEIIGKGDTTTPDDQQVAGTDDRQVVTPTRVTPEQQIRNFAAAALAPPASTEEFALCALWFIGLLALIYVLGSGIVTALSDNNTNRQKLRAGKLLSFIVGSIIALIVVSLTGLTCLVLPFLVVVLLLSVAELAYLRKIHQPQHVQHA